MINKIVFLAAVGGIALATGASALPLNPIRSDNNVDQARTVCDEYGRCWEVTNPAEDIARGVIGGLEGRSVDRHRGWDHDRRYRDRDGNRDRDNDDED